MANNTFTITLPVTLIARLDEAAAAAGTTPGKHAAALLDHALTRPTWAEVSEATREDHPPTLPTSLDQVIGERDRARDLAVMLEAENAQLVRLTAETVPELQAAVRALHDAVAAHPPGARNA